MVDIGISIGSEYFCCCAGIPSGSTGGEGGYVGFHTTDSGAGTTDMWSNFSHINDGNWHHITWVYDASSGTKKIYIDGALDSTQSVTNVGRGC